MKIPLSQVKILKNKFASLLSQTDWLSLLLSGQFHEFEQQLHATLLVLYDKICESLIAHTSESQAFISAQKELARSADLKKLETRQSSIQLRTGTYVKYASLYAKQAPLGYEGTRHLSLKLWNSSLSSGLAYKSLSCLYSVICPSFEVAKGLLKHQGISANFDRVRQLSLALSDQCMANRASVQLSPAESLRGKRVVIAMDGGRSRTREYQEGVGKRGQKFDTPWREPKLFVITIIDEKGNIDKQSKPIYDTTFGDDEVFDLLYQYLEKLDISEAKEVQFLADGAPWIWNRVRPMLLALGVNEAKIIETLDYYHAMEHLHEMKIYLDKDKQERIFKKLKDALWEGDFVQFTTLVKQAISGVDLKQFNPYKYFKKQRHRIDYQYLKASNNLCGSGIVESGIRRIINLRFKASSSFWYPENVEKLIFMRGIALAGRWEIMMQNLSKNQT